MKMTVDLKEHSYPIYIERGILKEAAERIAEVYQGSKIMIISDDRVYSYYGEALKKNLSEKYECAETVIPHGEPSKAFETLPGVYSSLLEAKISRTDLIVALGGGVVGDLAGFVAATFLKRNQVRTDSNIHSCTGRFFCWWKSCSRSSTG